MEINKWYLCPFQINGTTKPDTVYCKRGEKFRVFNDVGGVWLCETEGGNKFPVRASRFEGLVLTDKEEKAEEKKTEPKPILVQKSLF